MANSLKLCWPESIFMLPRLKFQVGSYSEQTEDSPLSFSIIVTNEMSFVSLLLFPLWLAW